MLLTEDLSHGQDLDGLRVVSPFEATFDGVINMPVMHQAVKAFLANQRQGNASTKTRGLVIGGNQKPWKQKGTGRARQGSTRAPHWVGGGTVFGPTPRSYAQYVPRQVRALARKSALNARARENAVMVIDRFTNDEKPKTSRMLAMLQRLGVDDRKVLILTDGVKPNVFLSARNIPTAHVMPYSDVSTYHILWSDYVLIEGSALGQELDPIEEKEPAPRPKKQKAAESEELPDRPPRRPRGAKANPTATKKPAAKKAPARKAAAKKSAAKKPAAKKAAAKKTTSAAKKKPGSAKKKGK
mgnify:CR=1 FL=1